MSFFEAKHVRNRFQSMSTEPSGVKVVCSQRMTDEERLKGLLLSGGENKTSSINYSVVAIVGREGIGKTALARLLFTNNLIKQKFELLSWACFSSDSKRVTEELLDCMTHDQACSSKLLSLEELQFRIQMLVYRKQCLIVLDDVREEKASHMDKLLAPFQYCAKGSKIVLTLTSSKIVLTLTNEDMVRFCYYLSPLPLDDAFWWTTIHNKFQRFLKEIISKCGGVPLLVKLFVGILQKHDEKIWEEVLSSGIRDAVQEQEMMPGVLCMIYNYLPAHLKLCFEFFSLYPFNHIISKDALLSIWIAEGFVQYSNDYSIMISRASQIFDELRCCGLIEDDMSIHNIIHELSCLVASKHYCRPGIRGRQEAAADKLRHVSLLGTKIEAADFQWLVKARSVFTIFLEAGHQELWSGFMDRLANWKSLRCLDFSEAEGVIELPSSISELKQLRYLRLYKCCLASLPNSICYLSNLQTLEVEWCSRLLTLPEEFGYLSNLCRLSFNMTRISGLPASFYNLMNLWELNLNETGIRSLSESVSRLSKLEILKCHGLSSFPLQLGALTQLRCLSDYTVGKGDSCGGIEALKDLVKLEGAICISGLENICSREEARSAELENKEFLQELTLKWTSGSNVKNQQDLEIAQALVPFSRIKSVSLVDYAGEIFPDWLSKTICLPFLDTVVISCCSRGGKLDLPNKDLIRRVEIRSCPKLKSVNLEMGESKEPKMKIDELIIVDCPILESIPESALCINRKLQIQKCSNLKINLDRLVNNMLNFVSLELLNVECYGTHLTFTQLQVNGNPGLRSLPVGLRNFEFLRIVELHDCPKLYDIHENALPLNIIKLRISGCPILPYLPTTLHTLTLLRSLKLHDLPQLRMLPNDDLPANLIKLHVTDCNLFKYFPPRLRGASLQVLHIINCHDIKSITRHQLPDNLGQLLVHDCEKLESITNVGIGNLTNLRTLQLTSCRKLSLLPTDLLSLTSLEELRVDYSSIRQSELPTTLKKLKVWGHKGFRDFPQQVGLRNPLSLERLKLSDILGFRDFPQQVGLRNLLSLERLKISDFPQLESLPKDIPSSLHHLSLCDCPALSILPGEIFKLNSLVKLKIINCNTPESFGEIELPSKLVKLEIINCQKLKYLPKTLIALNCLESLTVSSCPELELRLQDKLPNNLSMLKINECPKLVVSWNIMEHIPFRHIS